MDERLEQSRLLYERAMFGGEVDALDRADRTLDAVEADLALARGRVMHGRFLADRNEDPQELTLFERAARLYDALGDARGEAEARFWIGTFHQVVRDDQDAALRALERSRELAAQADDRLTLSYALRHLAFADQAAGRPDEARARLEESTRLRRELDFQPGIAANLVALAYFAMASGRAGEVPGLLDEAAAIAEANQAHSVLGWVAEARSAAAE